ncbi:MAG: hypothetical protein FVQ84_04375 [Planctomycetes bacterium]|nr:hypothetical protein [Planctomycetota bacterium]
MAFFKPLLRANRRTGLVFVHDKGIDMQVRSCKGRRVYWHQFIHSADIESDRKMDHLDIPRVANWVLVIPAYQCTTRYAVLPSVDSTEIDKMLEFELPNIAPYNTQPWAWDFSVIGQQEDGASKILIVLSPLSIIDRHLINLLSLGIKPQVITTSAMFHSLLLSEGKTLPDSNSVGCFFFDNDYMDFFTIENGKVAFLRGVRLKKEFCEDTRLMEAEIKRSLSTIKEHGYIGCPDAFLTISTNNSTIKFVKIVEAALGVSVKEIEPTSLYNEHLSIIDKLPALSSDHNFSSACPKAQVNLLPKHLKEKHHQGNKRRQMALHALKVCLILVLAFLCLKTNIRRKNRLLERYEQRLSAISPMAEKLQFLQQQLAIIENQLHGGVATLDIISELYRVLQGDVTVHYLSIEQDNKIVIRAQARLLSQAFDCISPLEQSDYFANVKQNYANQRQIQDSVLIDFEIVANLQNVNRRKDTK